MPLNHEVVWSKKNLQASLNKNTNRFVEQAAEGKSSNDFIIGLATIAMVANDS